MKYFVCDDDYKSLIPDAIYEVQCVGYDSKFCLGKTRKTFLNFIIISAGEYHGIKIFMAFNMPYDRKIRPGSKYYKTWVKVNGNRPPSRNTIMSPKLFVKRIYRIKTRTVKPLYPDGKPMPEQFWYSVVHSILELVA